MKMYHISVANQSNPVQVQKRNFAYKEGLSYEIAVFRKV